MFELTDQALTRVQPLLPANSRRGRPWRDHRQVLASIFQVESDKVIKRHPTPLLTCDDACAPSTKAITKGCGLSPQSSQVSRLIGAVREISRLGGWCETGH